MRSARLKIEDAYVEGIYCLSDCGLMRDRVTRLVSCAWIEAHENIVVISEGGGKGYVAQAIGASA